MSTKEFIARVAEAFTITPVNEAVHPDGPGAFGMYLAGQWYRLDIHADNIPDDPVGRLDVSLLASSLLAPVLGIDDPRRDKRIDFVGGYLRISQRRPPGNGVRCLRDTAFRQHAQAFFFQTDLRRR